MWELICDHRYTWGAIAADRSPYHTDGNISGATPLPGESGLKFDRPNSRITIPRRPDDPWGELRAINVEVSARCVDLGGMIIDASPSFRLWFEGADKIVVEVLGYREEFTFGNPPIGTWINFSFMHNGYNGFGHGYGWEAAKSAGGGGGTLRFVPGQVPPVGPNGVTFGNASSGPSRPLQGAIRSVKIWRANPRQVMINLLNRPFTPDLGACWSSSFGRFADAAAKDPDCANWLLRNIKQIIADVTTKLSGLPHDKLAEFWQLCAEYRQLWMDDQVGSARMHDLLSRLANWLRRQGVFSQSDPRLRAFLEAQCFKNMVSGTGGLECDDDVQILIRALLGVEGQLTTDSN